MANAPTTPVIFGGGEGTLDRESKTKTGFQRPQLQQLNHDRENVAQGTILENVTGQYGFDLLPAEASPRSIKSSVWEDWSGRGNHVDFRRDETLPLVAGRELGDGRNGFVHETYCKGIALAWKRRRCRGHFGPQQRREIEILKRLSHRHVIKLVGTYTHRDILGILLWPVAVCDLATLFEDMELLHHQDRLSAWEGRRAVLDERMSALGYRGFDSAHSGKWEAQIRERVAGLVGCLAGAVEFLHSKSIRHKDIKPANILLSENGMWLTDFDISTDFSLLSSSSTENGERGTPKYFAPEMAAYKPCGRAADIFTLGCVFIELSWMSRGKCLDELKALRPAQDQSYHANLKSIDSWLLLLEDPYDAVIILGNLVRRMLRPDPMKRPTAEEVSGSVHLLVHLSHAPWCGSCCDPQMVVKRRQDELLKEIQSTREQLQQSYQMINYERDGHKNAESELDNVLLPLADIEEKHARDKRRLRELGEAVSNDNSDKGDDEDEGQSEI